jgi:O-antigen/teichoic acid export membrane protein
VSGVSLSLSRDRSRPVRAAVMTSLAGKSAEMVTLLLLATVVPRVLGPSDYGRFAVPLTVVTLGSLALTLGGHTVMARYVPAAVPADREALARRLGARLARGRAVQLAAFGVVGAAVVTAAPDRFPPATSSLVLLALTLSVAATLALQITLGLGRAGPWSLRYPLQNAVLVAAVLAMEPVWGFEGSVLAILLSTVVAAGFAAVAVAPVLRGPVPPVAIPDGAIRFGVLLAAGAGLVQVAQRGSVLVVAVLAGSTQQTGFAALATGIALGVTYAVLQASTVSLPHLSDSEGDGSATGEAVLGRLSWTLLGVAVVLTLPAAMFLDELVPAVFGDGYEGAGAAFGWALALVVLAPVHALLVSVAALRLVPEASLAGGVATAVGFLVAAAIAVPTLEAAGGTLAVLVGTVAGIVVLWHRLPGAASARLVVASLAGAALVAALSVT